MARVSPPYSQLALIWDQMRQDNFSKRMVSYCLEIFKRFRIRPRTGLDVACGTGTAIQLFREIGIAMDGLDASSAMLAMAARKLKGTGVRLYHKPLTKFRLLDDGDSRLTRQYDLVTCFFDSLNYLTAARELQTAFRCIRHHLAPGGWFIFDMNTPVALRTNWNDNVYANVTEDIAWVFRAEYARSKKMAACHVTGFYKRKQAWHRFDETHWERAYDNEQIRRMLARSGFVVRGFFRCLTFRKPGPNADRIAVVAQRPKL